MNKFCEKTGVHHVFNADGICYECGFNLHEYTRPELTNEDKQAAENYARKTFRKYGIGQVVNMVASLCIENVRLLKEINEHRAARGIDPLPVFEV